MKILLTNYFFVSLLLVSCGKATDRTPVAPGATGSGPLGSGSGCTTIATPLAAAPSVVQASLDSQNTDTPDATFLVLNPNTFEKNVAKMIGNSCIECHSATTKKQKPLLDTYDEVKKTALKSLPLLKANKMPPAEGTDKPNLTEIKEFEKWITDGLLLGLDPDRTSAPPAGTAYNNDIRDFFKENCISCHKADGSQLPVLTSYDLAAAAGTKSLARLEAGTMPPRSAKNAAWTKLFGAWSDKDFPLLGDGSQDPTSSPSKPNGTSGESKPCVKTP